MGDMLLERFNRKTEVGYYTFHIALCLSNKVCRLSPLGLLKDANEVVSVSSEESAFQASRDLQFGVIQFQAQVLTLFAYTTRGTTSISLIFLMNQFVILDCTTTAYLLFYIVQT